MPTKIAQLLTHKYTIKVLASLIMILVIAISLGQWLLHAQNTAQNSDQGSIQSIGQSIGQNPVQNATQKITPQSDKALTPHLTTQTATHLPTNFAENSTVQVTEQENFNLLEWTLNLLGKLNWQQPGGSTFFSTLILFGFLSLATSIGLPRQIAALVAGINLGAFIGFVIATLATTLGCLITFSVARYLLSDKIARKYPSKLKTLSDFLGEQTFLKALVIRIFPLGSNFLTNIIAGVSKVSMPAYVSGSFVGFIPQMVIFSLAGSGLSLGAQDELIASAVLFIVALLLSTYIFKKHKEKSSGLK